MNVRCLVIGYGNPLRGDDGFGWAVADRLAAELDGDESVRVLSVHQLTPELAETISEAEQVIFVDVSRDGNPGTWSVTEVVPAPEGPALGHQFEACGLLAAAREIYSACPPALLVSAVAESFDCQETLTSCIEAIVPDVVRDIRNRIGAAKLDYSHA
ncbi:MAG TPA: hydrogenase maturation protease [Chthoniobacterales bacterium]